MNSGLVTVHTPSSRVGLAVGVHRLRIHVDLHVVGLEVAALVRHVAFVVDVNEFVAHVVNQRVGALSVERVVEKSLRGARGLRTVSRCRLSAAGGVPSAADSESALAGHQRVDMRREKRVALLLRQGVEALRRGGPPRVRRAPACGVRGGSGACRRVGGLRAVRGDPMGAGGVGQRRRQQARAPPNPAGPGRKAGAPPLTRDILPSTCPKLQKKSIPLPTSRQNRPNGPRRPRGDFRPDKDRQKIYRKLTFTVKYAHSVPAVSRHRGCDAPKRLTGR